MVSAVRLDSVFFAAIAVAFALILEFQTRDGRGIEKLWLKVVGAAVFTTYISLEVFALLQGTYCLLVDGLLFDWVAVRAFGWGIAATVLYLLLENEESTFKEGLKSAWEFALVLPASIVTLYCVFGIEVPASAS